MAKLPVTNENRVETRSVALPSWMWTKIDEAGVLNRGAFFRKVCQDARPDLFERKPK